MRHTGEKKTVSLDSTDIAKTTRELLSTMQVELLAAARGRLSEGTYSVKSYGEMKARIAASNTRDNDSVEGSVGGGSDTAVSEIVEGSKAEKAGFYLVPWKCDRENEAFIKEDCKATIRCYPLALNQAPPPDGVKCFYSGDQATHMAIFARAF